jgi:hypothetical protein
VLKELLVGPLRFPADVDDRRRRYRFSGAIALDRLVAGVIELKSLTGGTSPEGFVIRVSPGFDGFSDCGRRRPAAAACLRDLPLTSSMAALRSFSRGSRSSRPSAADSAARSRGCGSVRPRTIDDSLVFGMSVVIDTARWLTPATTNATFSDVLGVNERLLCWMDIVRRDDGWRTGDVLLAMQLRATV